MKYTNYFLFIINTTMSEKSDSVWRYFSLLNSHEKKCTTTR